MCYLGLDTGKGRGKKHLFYSVYRVIRPCLLIRHVSFVELLVIVNLYNIVFGFSEEYFNNIVVELGFYNPTLRQNSTDVTSRYMQRQNSEDRKGEWEREGAILVLVREAKIFPALKNPSVHREKTDIATIFSFFSVCIVTKVVLYVAISYLA